VLYFFTPGVPGIPGYPAQARKDKQACQSNLACLLKAGGARAVQQTSEKKQASF